MSGEQSSLDGGLRLDGKNDDKIMLSVAVFLACFVLSFIVSSLIIVPQGTKAVTGLDLAHDPTMTLTTDNDNIFLSPIPTVNGGLTSASHTLKVSTNVPMGYNLTLAAVSPLEFAPTTGTITSPTTLDSNTWGYALASTSAVGVANDFDASYAVPTPSADSRWANPAVSTMIKNTSAAVMDDATSVYYGAKVDMSLASGVYANAVTYTGMVNVSMIPTPSIISITPSSGTIVGGTAIEIIGTGFTVNDQSVTLGITIGGVACTNVSISSNTPITGQDTIYCNTPGRAVAGAVDVDVATWVDTATAPNGYTYIAPAAVTFVSPSIASTIAGAESGPAFTIVGAGFTGATDVTIGGTACASFTIVSDRQIFCTAPNTINTTGDKAIVVTKSNMASTGIVSVAYDDKDYPTLQSSDAYASCSTSAQIFRDTRDSQLYYVKKMPDNKCWMVDNLKYANFGTLSQVDGQYLTVDGTNVQSAQNSDVAKYVDPGAVNYCVGGNNMPTNTNTRCGLLYNWYAATNGTGTYFQSADGNQATGSICPVNFRLPSAMSGVGGPTTNGMEYTAADMPVLNVSMEIGILLPGTTSSFYAGWQPSGVWGGVFSGYWSNGFGSQGSSGSFWSSTTNSSLNARYLTVYPSSVYAGNNFNNKRLGYAVRCVMDAPPTPPAGTNPPNISNTNPAVLDVYPTTGWEGDIIAITSNAKFTNVGSVTVGGTACTDWGVVTTSLITCKLPARVAGTSNDIAVINNSTNITPASTYTHMKITYFNPSTTTVTINNITYDFYPNGFTNANCTAMTPSNAAIGATPAASLAYVRDIRNNQTYKVKKMVDNKCWMVDNLKYIDTQITNTADNTTGMTYNSGDHLNDGGTTAVNTVDETAAQSPSNSDKAFYNNPMSTSYCYGTTNMPNNTLTHCGYFYNWYAATNGTGTYAQSTYGNNVTGNICPAGFRLPSATSNGTTPTSNGTSYNAADFAVLNASMNAGTLATGATTSSFYADWQPSGAWGGSFAGVWGAGFGGQGSNGYFWSSTADSVVRAFNFFFNSSYVSPGNGVTSKHNSFTVRCVLP